MEMGSCPYRNECPAIFRFRILASLYQVLNPEEEIYVNFRVQFRFILFIKTIRFSYLTTLSLFLTLLRGLSTIINTRKMFNNFALLTAALTFSIPSENIPLPSDKMVNNFASSE